jgi:TonB-linked SusC/RagA family outer membrane protein
MKKTVTALAALLFFGVSLSAQSIRVTGTVTDQTDGTTLPGVTVVVKGTTTGTVTSMDGTYSLNVPSAEATLVFSFVGMQTLEVDVAGRSVINVIMSPVMMGLDEVLVVAYGTASRQSITGGVSVVESAEIERRPISSVTSALEGVSAGVQVNNTYGEPGSSPSIRIRGFTSISGSNAPLYVIDGVPFGGNISDLNPGDIESITVLKDAASAALYGNRASNGVILITTKRGKSDRLSFRVTSNQGVYNRGLKEYDKLEPEDFMEVMWLGYRNSMMTNIAGISLEEANARASNNLVSTILGYNVFNTPADELFASDGRLEPWVAVRSGYTDLDWFEPFERLGYRQEYNVSADAATEKASLFFSGGYLDEKGYIHSSDFRRFTARSNMSVTPNRWIRAGLTVVGSHQEYNNTDGTGTSIRNPWHTARGMAPIYPIYLHDPETGAFLLDGQGKKIFDDGMSGRQQHVGRNVVWEWEMDRDKTYRSTLQGIAFADITFLQDFTFSLKGDLNVRSSENRTFRNPIIGDGQGNNGRASRDFNRYNNHTFQQLLKWEKNFDNHTVDILAGHESYSWNRAYHTMRKDNQTMPGNMEYANFTEISTLGGYSQDYRTESYLSRVRYNFSRKYYVDGSFRRDGTSRFHKDYRWGNFWSLGGSWVISREEFMKDIPMINNLRLRASYGEVGNDNVGSYYAYMGLYFLTQNANRGAAYLTQLESYDLQWETSGSFGTALEGRLFDRMNVTIEYFDKRSKNLLFDVNNPLSAGGTSTGSAESVITKNIGSIANRGVEFTTDVDVIRTSDIRLNLGFNLTHYKNEILRLPEENRENGIISGSKRYLEGYGIYDFWLFQFVGVDQMTGMALYEINFDNYHVPEYDAEDNIIPVEGLTPIDPNFLVQIGDEHYVTRINEAKRDWSGSAIPDLFGSFRTTMNYKNFSLSGLFTFSIGGKVLDYSYQRFMGVSESVGSLHADLLDAWNGVPEGMTETSSNRIKKDGVPRIDYATNTYTNATSTRFLKDASYLVIKNLALSYNLPTQLVHNANMQGVTLTLSIDNLATFTTLQGMNPQQGYAGLNNNEFVTARVFSLGVNLRF